MKECRQTAIFPCPPFKKKLCIYFWLCWVFIAAWAFLHCGEPGLFFSCSERASHCSGFSCCRAEALEHRHGSYLPWGMRDFPGLGIKPVSPALAGRFSTTGLQGSLLRVSLALSLLFPFLNNLRGVARHCGDGTPKSLLCFLAQPASWVAVEMCCPLVVNAAHSVPTGTRE